MCQLIKLRDFFWNFEQSKCLNKKIMSRPKKINLSHLESRLSMLFLYLTFKQYSKVQIIFYIFLNRWVDLISKLSSTTILNIPWPRLKTRKILGLLTRLTLRSNGTGSLKSLEKQDLADGKLFFPFCTSLSEP